MLDGEEYLVIDLDNYMASDTEETSTDDVASPYSVRSGDSPIGLPPVYWYDCGYVDLDACGGSYSDGCYISSGDHYSRIFCFNNERNMLSGATAKMYMKDTFPLEEDNYIMDVWVHNDHTGDSRLDWDCVASRQTFYFNLLNGHANIIFSGSANQIIDGIAIKFYQDSPGKKTFLYTLEVAVKKA